MFRIQIHINISSMAFVQETLRAGVHYIKISKNEEAIIHRLTCMYPSPTYLREWLHCIALTIGFIISLAHIPRPVSRCCWSIHPPRTPTS